MRKYNYSTVQSALWQSQDQRIGRKYNTLQTALRQNAYPIAAHAKYLQRRLHEFRTECHQWLQSYVPGLCERSGHSDFSSADRRVVLLLIVNVVLATSIGPRI